MHQNGIDQESDEEEDAYIGSDTLGTSSGQNNKSKHMIEGIRTDQVDKLAQADDSCCAIF